MASRLHPVALAHTTPQARRGRSLAEWLLVRFPALYPRLSRAAMRMSERRRRAAIAYVAKREYAAYNRRDWELNTLHVGPGYVLTWGDVGARPPDARDTYRGVEGYIEFCELWLRELEDSRFELIELREAGPDRIVALVRETVVAGGGDLVLE